MDICRERVDIRVDMSRSVYKKTFRCCNHPNYLAELCSSNDFADCMCPLSPSHWSPLLVSNGGACTTLLKYLNSNQYSTKKPGKHQSSKGEKKNCLPRILLQPQTGFFAWLCSSYPSCKPQRKCHGSTLSSKDLQLWFAFACMVLAKEVELLTRRVRRQNAGACYKWTCMYVCNGVRPYTCLIYRCGAYSYIYIYMCVCDVQISLHVFYYKHVAVAFTSVACCCVSQRSYHHLKAKIVQNHSWSYAKWATFQTLVTFHEILIGS